MQVAAEYGKIQTNRRPLKCPCCGKGTILYLLPSTQVKDLPVKCKQCGKESIVNISAAPAPSVPVP